MDLNSRISLFLAVVEHDGFAAAARHLGISGPAISKQVQALEDDLGVRLLHRTTRKVSLSEAGEIYYERARKAMEDLEEAQRYVQDLKSSPVGVLKVSAPMSFGSRYLSAPIAAFAAQYPDVRMQVDFDDRNVDVIGEGYDVVVRIGALDDSSLIAKKLAPCPIYLCAGPEFISRHGFPQRPDDLGEYPAIIYTRHGQNSEWHYGAPDGGKGSAKLNPHFQANSAEMMLEACLQNIGIAALPVFTAAPYLKAGRLTRLLPDYNTVPDRAIHAIFPQNRHLSAKTRLFVDWLTESCKALPW